MKIIRAIIRPEKEGKVLEGLNYENKDKVIDIIIENARTETDDLKASGLQVNMSGPGRPGDGKIFVSDVNEAYTISDGSGL